MESKDAPEAVEVVQEPDFLKQYRAAYPKNKKFHVTGDHLVFLNREYKQALAHQKTIARGELKTY